MHAEEETSVTDIMYNNIILCFDGFSIKLDNGQEIIIIVGAAST